MWTGKPSLVGTLFLFVIDMGWAFNGPFNWGNGSCSLGNIQLDMVAKINIEFIEGTTTELVIPDVSPVTCVNVSGTDQYQLFVTWSTWSFDLPKPGQSTNPPDSSTKVPKQGSTTLVTEEASSTKQSSKADETTTAQNVRLLEMELKHEAIDSISGIADGRIEDWAPAASEMLTTGGPSPLCSDTLSAFLREAGTGTSISASVDSGDLDISAAADESAQNNPNVSESTTDGVNTFTVSSTDESAEDSDSQSTISSDVTTSFEVDLTKPDSIESKKLSGDMKITSLSPYHNPPDCDMGEHSSSSRLPKIPDPNRLTITITKKNSLFSVSDIELRFTTPESPVSYYVSWRNVDLFPGPVDVTHVCENDTKLQFYSHGPELVLQQVKLAAYLPHDRCEFPEKKADCNVKYEKDIAREMFRNAEVILITIGTFLGVLLLGSLGFYAAKLYCNSKRERDARDTLP